MNPSTNRLPLNYTLDSFLLEMRDFFGGGVNTLTLERDLANLRQTGSVSDYAIKFQNITNCSHPRWPNILVFSPTKFTGAHRLDWPWFPPPYVSGVRRRGGPRGDELGGCALLHEW